MDRKRRWRRRMPSAAEDGNWLKKKEQRRWVELAETILLVVLLLYHLSTWARPLRVEIG